ncbi:MAG: 50S ribosomal protein L9 [Planctomycetota bacterium]
MKILLRRTIEGVGEVGEIVRVKNGYARNYLLPQGMAALVSEDSLRRVEKDKEREAVRQAEEARKRAAVADRLAELTLTVEARAGDDGHLYGSVGPRQALESFKQAGFDLEERQIRFEPIRELGEYEVPVQLTREHAVNVRLWVVQDAREAAAAAAEAAKRAEEEEAQAAAGEATPAEEPAAD